MLIKILKLRYVILDIYKVFIKEKKRVIKSCFRVKTGIEYMYKKGVCIT